MLADVAGPRHAGVRAAMVDHAIDGLLITQLANIRYLTGFSGTAALLLATADSMTLITDFRYAGQAEAEVGTAATVAIDRANVWERAGRAIAECGIERLGVESGHMTLADAARCGALGRFQIVSVSGIVESLRASKSAAEVDAICGAIAIAHAALAEVLPTVRAGQSELAVAARLEAALRIRGSEWHPFPTIVASGPRTALPHARTSARVIERGDWLLIDFGAQWQGYCSDITRTCVVGSRAVERQREVYDVVRAAQRRAMDGMAAGQTGRDADALARDSIVEAGYGEAFGHSLGHGIGLEVHEQPRLAATAGERLPSGAVVTIEPGIYLPGWGGVRIEDDVHLLAGGTTCLSDGQTELLELV